MTFRIASNSFSLPWWARVRMSEDGTLASPWEEGYLSLLVMIGRLLCPPVRPHTRIVLN